MIVLERIGVGKSDGEYHVKLFLAEGCKDFRKRYQSREELEHWDGDLDSGGDR